MSRSSVEVEYQPMVQTTREMKWLKSLLTEFDFTVQLPMPMHCDNQTVIFIANNPIFNEQTKHIEIHCHYVRDIVMTETISTPYTPSSFQFANIFTMGLAVGVFRSLCNKLGMLDIYVLA